VVIERLWRRHVSCAHAMTVIASQTFISIVTGVTKTESIRSRLVRSAREASELVTRAARRDVAPVHLRGFRVTTETRDVRIHARWDRETLATPVGPVTRRTAGAERSVFRVVEFDVETLQRWKRFNFSALRVCVADRTDLACRIRELLRVTTGARRMRGLAWQCWLRRVVLAAMTEQTRETCVGLVIVLELRVASLSHKKAQKEQQQSQNLFVLFCGHCRL